MAVSRPGLPIDALLPEIARSLQVSRNLVIEAAPGAGKTTRVPPVLLNLVPGEVLVLEPRRIAARLAARRTAAEMGEQVGESVGYQVRFDEVSGPRTRLRFLTEGVLTRRLLSDPDLRGVDAVVLDEFHERHLETDLALALLKRMQGRRPELRIVVMSATLDAGPVAAFLGNCPVLRSSGKVYELQVRHRPYSAAPLEQQVRAALEDLLRAGHCGHVLVFLPGAAEIRRAMRECEGAARGANALVLPLHGDLSPDDQDRAIAPNTRQKIIFSTNIAESSVTIEGVTAVIDSGLARSAAYSPWSGLPTLQVGRISRASAIQRAGRAGRTGPGVVLRLYPQADFAQRPEHDLPEILRSDLGGLCLSLRAMQVSSIFELAWLDPPPDGAVQQAEDLLARLAAHEGDAEKLARLPLPPRLARVVVDAAKRNVAEEGVAAAALLSAGTRFEVPDLLRALDLPRDANTERQRQQLRRLIRSPRQSSGDEDALLLAVLSGFPDRVARRRAGNLLLLANGVSAELLGSPPAYEFMTVLDAEVRSDRQMPIVRMTARIEPEWLLDLFPDQVREEVSVEWNQAAERVEVISALRYGALVLEESRSGRGDPHEVAQLLADKALQAGVERFVDAEALQQTLARIRFSGLTEPDAAGALRELCTGLRSFTELRDAAAGLLPALEARAGSSLRDLAPTSVRLPGGRQTKVRYDAGRPPWVESRLQDFFGMTETPRIGPDKTPVVVHLLAPNRRAVQTTTDLAGFWGRLYPQVRRELMRRYPRHAWPEDPLTSPVRDRSSER